MNTSDFFYELPERLIAQTPLEQRDASRLMVIDRQSGKYLDKHFFDLPEFLKKGDVLVVNRTKVLPARLIGAKSSGGKIEILLLKRIDLTHWHVLVKPGKKAKIGTEIIFSDTLSCIVKEHTDDGGRIVEFKYDGVFEDILNQLGTMPLPHYIKQELKDQSRYQTVYSKEEGSAAAPTAGLHFTKELLYKLKNMGVEIAEVLLHVGLGTFRPVKVKNIAEHKMHSEYYSISAETADIINKARKEGRRVIAVGTTSVRVLESVADENGFMKEQSGDTSIFIYPGYRFKAVDALITNFHLPESTLIMLVSAFMGREKTLECYNEAVKKEYRFFSFGDAMFIADGISE